MPKCKNCKQQFTPVSFNRKYCIENECNDMYYEELKKQMYKSWNKEKKVKKEKLQTVQELLKLAQVVFNTYIRHRDRGLNCISCDKPPKKANAGHFWSSGGHKNVTFNEDNVHLQCEHCNTYLHGNLINYQKNLIKKIGVERYDELEKESHKTKKFDREELKELIKEYKQKTKL